MKTANMLRATLVAGLVTAGLQPAFAAPAPTAAAGFTTAGTTVSNTASVAYKVGTVDQDPVSSNTVDFTVDRKVNVTVTADNSPLSVVPGVDDYVLEFTVTNESNAALDFNLAVLQTANTTTLTPLAATDNLTMNGFQYFVDDGDDVYEPGVDTATSITNLAPGAGVKVFVIADTPTTAANDAYAGVSVLVTARELGGAALTATVGADTAGTMDTVFADGDGPVTGDANRDAIISAYGAYHVVTATLSVNKSATVAWDPVNLAVSPKAIPGAEIEYCLVVKNSGAVAAADIVLTDAVPAETTYKAGSLRIDATGTDTSCDLASGTVQTDASGDDDAEHGGAGKGAVTVRASTVGTPNGVFRATFRVTVD